jgi:hypothetical protein
VSRWKFPGVVVQVGHECRLVEQTLEVGRDREVIADLFGVFEWWPFVGKEESSYLQITSFYLGKASFPKEKASFPKEKASFSFEGIKKDAFSKRKDAFSIKKDALCQGEDAFSACKLTLRALRAPVFGSTTYRSSRQSSHTVICPLRYGSQPFASSQS